MYVHSSAATRVANAEAVERGVCKVFGELSRLGRIPWHRDSSVFGERDSHFLTMKKKMIEVKIGLMGLVRGRELDQSGVALVEENFDAKHVAIDAEQIKQRVGSCLRYDTQMHELFRQHAMIQCSNKVEREHRTATNVLDMSSKRQDRH